MAPNSTTEPVPRQRADGDKKDRARKIADAALRLFAERDFASVSIKQIGEEIGIHSSLLYYYFTSKEHLFYYSIESAIQQALENFDRIRSDHSRPEDIINDWFDTNYEMSHTISDLLKIMLNYARSSRPAPPVDDLIRQFYDEEYRILAGAFRDGMAQGSFRNVDGDRLAQFVSSHLDGMIVASILRPEFDLKQAFDDLRGILWHHLSVSEDGEPPSPQSGWEDRK